MEISQGSADRGGAARPVPQRREAGVDDRRLHGRDAAHRRASSHTRSKFRHMPVLDKDRLTGMVSIGDVLKWQIETIRERIHQLELAIDELNLMRL